MAAKRSFRASCWRRGIVLLLTLLAGESALPQGYAYDELKEQMDEHSLPLVNLIIDLNSLEHDDFVPGHVEITDFRRRTDGEEVAAFHCLCRYRGGSAMSYQKKSLALKLTDEEGENLDANLLGIREENSWILDAMAIDRIRMRNLVCFNVWNAISHTPYPSNFNGRNGIDGEFVELFVNGVYHGLYCLTDKVDRKLLGLKKAKVEKDGTVTPHGLLYKGISWGSGCYLTTYTTADVNQTTWNAWELQYPDEYPDAYTWQPLMDLIDFCSWKTATSNFLAAYQEYFHVENLVDYMVFTLAMNVGDNAYKNTFLSVRDIQEEHRYLITPWDMDMSLGGHWNGLYDEEPADINRYNRVAPFNRLYGQGLDGFREKVKQRWIQLKDGLLNPDSICQRLDDYGQRFLLSGAWEREYARWNGSPIALKASVAEELDYVKDWYRRNWVELCRQTGCYDVVSNPTDQRPRAVSAFTLDGRKLKNRELLQYKGIAVVGNRKVIRK